ncbi:MAG TPA: cupin domain-containing protein [Rhodocyclaceae bacterium]|uniref:cupin domain-containing protein n=1 Tax=Zoogloea sp. TaxID=49181 RepID=UPI002BF1504A|nr:cupin domain-containing protein [Zoogloea sp.]HMV18473.1 cupin domain-containing protein [Rhodocyclaceae bacterium]HMV62374.1 cupin domain-containing protein [Rhodocyclaceae bacterium]HMW50995.1 cupin domain-containing protein [Rhodocyclaceae bacterium]HMY49115.1 cupin domain-containing protein [Rhodocyclaceae bacterium]HNF61706.1 cupin domain-containing protein [Rhodocyclaceae bacterium]
MIDTLLGGLSVEQFLAEYWQKKPLLIRQAIPGFTGVVSRDDLFALARDPDVESRFIAHDGARWEVLHGPQKATDLRRKKQPWTVLVQGLNLFVPEGDALLHRFDFIPQARLDDLMVSYAVDGGGVGPHFDNYDVFLLQGIGQRRWLISNQDDRSLIEDVPLKILQDFRPVHDWVLESGDMLYLPPHWAHNGIALGECTTYSIGFRSPTYQELAQEFLVYLQDAVQLEGLYADPDLKRHVHSAEIGDAMVDRVAEQLARITWTREDVRRFLGAYLTEPKPHVFFDSPDEPLDHDSFLAQCNRAGYVLDARSLLLFSDGRFFLNGEAVSISHTDLPVMIELADRRRISTVADLTQDGQALLYDWYCCGFAHPDSIESK